ncbi:cuticle protein 16.8-like [Limulus polyphemus]|uniref:Cuticle protein 16.8-like n=1 Tax=Limulus polyphemus TaxID=6850 RepID=A0ABM1SWK2_LIMPO|nr:cuticle protein 16.8-like [Limulus polyphemus]
MLTKVVLLCYMVSWVSSAPLDSYGTSLPVQAFQPAELYKGRETYTPDVYEQEPPKPFSFGYQSQDDDGNTQQREEAGDENGNVRGNYGYTDAYGLFRKVNYVADVDGFRAKIESNEPGITSDDPAFVQIDSQEPPAHIQEAYSAPNKPKAFTESADRSYSQPHRYVAPRPVPARVALTHPVPYGVNPAVLPVRGLSVSPHGAVRTSGLAVSPYKLNKFHAPSFTAAHY